MSEALKGDLPFNYIKCSSSGLVRIRTKLMEMMMAPMMLLTEEDLNAVAQAYRCQIDFGSDERTALNLATIVYQQRHPYAVAANSRTLVGDALAKSALH
ncbi:MAG: hypothetical protein HOM25_15475 [Rhodospirillaceae bacterium]|jgi:hypothetical protein|nr:hypothetical protein [Rhodospirillaceae bacterium]MBT5667060.1 hypothetical protein [Rhodospirillaceae bacterium]